MGHFTVTLGINIIIGTFLFCDVLKFLLKNYYSEERSVHSWKKVCIRGKIRDSITAQ